MPQGPAEVSETSFNLLHTSYIEHLQARQHAGWGLERSLEQLGFDVGVRLAERYSKDTPRLVKELDIMTFLCKDMWLKVFRKNADKLRTNHKGVYEIFDSRFRVLVSSVGDNENSRSRLFMPCGMMRGALFAFGINASVTAEAGESASCVFTIKVKA